jgi:hypothetical protein
MVNVLGFSFANEGERIEVHGSQVGERVAPLPPQQEVRHARWPTFGIVRRHSVMNPDQSVGAVIWQRTEENRVYQAKNGRRRADAYGKCEAGYRSAAEGTAHRAQTVKKVSNYLLKHEDASSERLM